MTTLLRRVGIITIIVGSAIGGSITRTHAAATPLIVNGGSSSISSRPYQAGILDIRFGADSYHRFQCGGSVVAPKIIVTAGHCTFDSLSSAIPTAASNLRVLVNTSSLLSGGQVVKVSSIVRHPGYRPDVDSTLNDIALLKLTTAVTAPPVSIIPSQSDYRAQVVGVTATVSGWGCYQASSDCRNLSNYPTDLRKANVAVHSNSYCSSVFNRIGVGFNGSAALCAGNLDFSVSAPSPCYGDSGGPLTIDGIGGKDQLIGVVSWGVKCGATPAAYSRISTYRNWLVSNGVPVTPTPFSASVGPVVGSGLAMRTGDFDGDGNDDLLDYIPNSSPDQIYRGITGPMLTAGSVATISSAYNPVACDLNEDNRTDLVLYGPGTNIDRVLLGAAEPGSFTSGQAVTINGVYTPLAGDFNGDNFCDLVLYGPGTAADRLLIGDGTGAFVTTPMTQLNNVYQPVVGDWNNDGIDDIYWYSTSSVSRRWDGGVGGFTAVSTTSRPGNFRPIAGDFDGNGYSDVLLYGPGTAPDVLWSTDATGFHQRRDVSINGTYRTATADLDGDGTTEIIWQSVTSNATSIWTWAL